MQSGHHHSGFKLIGFSKQVFFFVCQISIFYMFRKVSEKGEGPPTGMIWNNIFVCDWQHNRVEIIALNTERRWLAMLLSKNRVAMNDESNQHWFGYVLFSFLIILCVFNCLWSLLFVFEILKLIFVLGNHMHGLTQQWDWTLRRKLLFRYRRRMMLFFTCNFQKQLGREIQFKNSSRYVLVITGIWASLIRCIRIACY